MAGDLVGEEFLVADGTVTLDPEVGGLEVPLVLRVLYVHLISTKNVSNREIILMY